jgi:hypothetical protein
MAGKNLRRLTAMAALFSAALVLNCECDDGLSALPYPAIEILDHNGESHLEADPFLVVGFDASPEEARTRTLKVKSVGTGRLKVENVCLVSAQNLEEATDKDTPCILSTSAAYGVGDILGEYAPGEEIELPVTYFPENGGATQLFLRFQTNATTKDGEARPFDAIQLVAPSGQLCADNAVVDFGSVIVGDTATQTVTLTSCGIKPVAVDAADFIANPDDVFSVVMMKDGAPVTAPTTELAEGEAITLDITFAPEQVRIYRDALAGQYGVTTAAPFNQDYTLVLLGTATARPTCRVNVVPQTVQFGAVAANETATQPLIIQSVGECGCEVTALDGPTPGDNGFSIPNPPALPFVLRGSVGCEGDPAGADAADNRLTIDIQYTSPDRQNPITDNATLDVTTTDVDEPTRTVNLEANGGGTPYCELDVSPEGGGLAGGLIPVQGRFGVVNFGRVTIHNVRRQPIELKNVGNSACTISMVDWDSAPNTQNNEFGLEHEDGTPVAVGGNPNITIGPGNSHIYMAVFSPTHTIESDNPLDVFNFGSYSASNEFCSGLLSGPNERCNGVRFQTNDTVTDTSGDGSGQVDGSFSIGFSATPVEPAIDIIPGQIDFGLVTVGCGSLEQQVTVYNTGSGDLEVGEPYIDPTTNPAEFVITGHDNPTGTWPYLVPPGGTLRLLVRFYAQNTGPHFANLVIPTLEGGQAGPEFSVPLSGEGTYETEQTDIFDQFSDPKVDVLWVVDDSGSMGPFQTQLANNFDDFFTASNVSAADYHIAVTTTLTTDGNCLNPFGTQTCSLDPMAGYYTSCSGNDRFLTPASAGPEAQFTCNVRVSDSGNVNPNRPASDNAEGGLQAARTFLEPPNIDDPGINGGFMRDDAKLHVILVSDEPDQSEGPIDLYVDFFRNLKGFRNDSLVAVSAIATPSNGCTLSDGTAISGNARYEDAVNELNGRFQSICDDDWTNTMQNLGLDSLGLQVEFFLSRAADAATLDVCVRTGGASDGNCVTQTQTAEGQADGYFYDPLSNSIVFNPNSVPPRGARIEVHYTTYCY